MANTPAVKTLTHLENDIILAIKNNIITFSGMLFANKLIDDDQYEDAGNARIPTKERARNLIAAVRDKIIEEDSRFLTLLDVFDSNRAEYEVIIGKLRQTYKKNGNTKNSNCSICGHCQIEYSWGWIRRGGAETTKMLKKCCFKRGLI